MNKPLRIIWFCLLAPLAGGVVQAHELRPAYLDIRQKDPNTFDILWKVPARGDLKLALYVRFSAECKETQTHKVYHTNDSHTERWQMRGPENLAGQRITIDGLSSTYTDVLIRLQWLDGRTQMIRLDAGQTSFAIPDEPSEQAGEYTQLTGVYVLLGIEHILLGVDHLLFVLGLLLIVRSFGKLVQTITAFTIAHSISLALAVLGVVHVPSRPVNAAIALSIVFLAAEILYAQRGHRGLTVRAPWLVAFLFGLLHGLGFAGALTTLGLPQSDIPLALLLFNVGVEIGQLLFVLLFLVLAWSFRTLEVHWPSWSEPLPAYMIGTIATFWFLGRLQVMLSL